MMVIFSSFIWFRENIGKISFNEFDGDIDRRSYTTYKVDIDGIPR